LLKISREIEINSMCPLVYMFHECKPILHHNFGSRMKYSEKMLEKSTSRGLCVKTIEVQSGR
jgi:hypothetical protein